MRSLIILLAISSLWSCRPKPKIVYVNSGCLGFAKIITSPEDKRALIKSSVSYGFVSQIKKHNEIMDLCK